MVIYSITEKALVDAVNVARAYAHKEGYNLSVGATKTLMHNAAMLDQFNSKITNIPYS